MSSPPLHHETSDVEIRGILLFGAGLLVTAVVIHVLIWLLFLYFSDRAARGSGGESQYPLAVGLDQRVPPEPRLQVNPREDLAALQAREDEILRSYSWVDKNAGIVRIPIDEAMRLTVERGLPARQENNAKR